MGSGFLSIGITGIRAAQLGLLATEHNITNANTPGYSRQRTVQATNIAVNTGSGAIGQGVNVATIERMNDRFLTAQVNTATSKLSEINTYYAQISEIDNLLADPSAGLTPALQDFFSGVQQIASNPSLLSSRQLMISSAQTLVSRFASIDSRLDELAEQTNGKIAGAVMDINSYASQIADLNQRIIIAESSYGQPPNDMLDQRDQLVNQLNQLIKVNTSENSDGSFNVFVGSGQQLVVGAIAMKMTALPSVLDPERFVVGLETTGGGSLELPEKLIVGGQLGGLVAFRSDSLDRARNELGRVAASVAMTFNAQHALGQDLLGRANGDSAFQPEFFSLNNSGPGINANTNNAPGATFSASFLAPSFGPEAATGNFLTNLGTSDYRLTKIDATNYSLVRLSDGEQLLNAPGDLVAVNQALAAEGLQVSISGDSPNDSFLIQPYKNIASNLSINPVIAADSRLVAAAAPFRTTADSANTGTASISAGRMVGGTNGTFDTTLNPLPVSISYDAANNELIFGGAGAPAVGNMLIKYPGNAEAVAVAPLTYQQGMVISFNGMSFEINGVPDDGDQFTLERNVGATVDGRNGLALGQLQTKNTVAGGTATFQTAYAEMVANNGIKTRELKIVGDAQQSVLNQAVANQQALSGVNLDEEAANMIRFQQAYQASAKVLEIGKSLFDTLLQIG